MSRRNPLIAPVEEETASPEPPDIADQLLGEDVTLKGPQHPLLLQRLQEESLHNPVLPWPRVEVTDHRLVTIAGLHGGAGTSTVARLFGDDAVDAGQGWPVAAGWRRPLPRLSVLVVARTHRVGLEAAEQFTRQWTAGELDESQLLGLVLVDDGPRLLRAQAREAKRLLKLTPRGAHIPWNEHWRVAEPDQGALPRRLKKIIHGYRDQAQTTAQAETPEIPTETPEERDTSC